MLTDLSSVGSIDGDALIGFAIALGAGALALAAIVFFWRRWRR